MKRLSWLRVWERWDDLLAVGEGGCHALRRQFRAFYPKLEPSGRLRSRRHRALIGVERLEDRELLTVQAAPTNFTSYPAEGNSGLLAYGIRVWNDNGMPVHVDWQTSEGTATVANNDYVAASGSFDLGWNQFGFVTVYIVGDTDYEYGSGPGSSGSPGYYEEFYVTFNATVHTAHIVNDDQPPPPQPPDVTANDFTVDEGRAWSGVVAAFTDADSTTGFSIQANWGNANLLSGSLAVVPVTSNSFEIHGADLAFKQPGTHTFSITVTDPTSLSDSDSALLSVVNGELRATTLLIDLAPIIGVADASVTLGHTLTNLLGDDESLSFEVNWGDGNSSLEFGSVPGHEYEDPGVYPVSITVTGAGRTATARTTAAIGPERTTVAPAVIEAEQGEALTDVTLGTFLVEEEYDDGDVPLVSEYEVKVYWGDGGSSTWSEVASSGDITVEPTGTVGEFLIRGSHAFEQAGIFGMYFLVSRRYTDPVAGEVSEVVATELADVVVAATQPVESPILVELTPKLISTNPADGITLGTFKDLNPAHLDDAHTIIVDWGDGASSAGEIGDAVADGYLEIEAAHTYDDAGVYTIVVTVADETGHETSARSTLVVTPPADFTGKALHIAATGSNGPLLIGSFANWPDLISGDVSFVVDWGDGTRTDAEALTVFGKDGSFRIAGDHAYEEAGQYLISVFLTDVLAGTWLPIRAAGQAFVGDFYAGAAPGSVFLGTFEDENPISQASDFGGWVYWTSGGTPGTPSVQTIDPATPDWIHYEVSGSAPAWDTPGLKNVIAAIHDQAMSSSSVDLPMTFDITAARPDGSATPLNIAVGALTNQTVLSLTTSDATGDPVSARIDWGDGALTTATLEGSPGSYTVTGSHPYASPGTFTIHVLVAMESGNEYVFTTTAIVTHLIWDNGGDGYSWFDPLNWNLDRVPEEEDSVFIGAGYEVHIEAASASVISVSSEGSLYAHEPLTLAGVSFVHGHFASEATLTLTGEAEFIASGGGELRGTISLAADEEAETQTVFEIGGDYTFGQLTHTGDGLFRMTDVTAELTETVTLRNTEYNGGTISGDGELIIEATFTWFAGEIDPSSEGTAANVLIQSGAAVRIEDGDGGGDKSTGREWTNNGTVEWLSNEMVTATGQFNNQTNGSVLILGNGNFNGAMPFNNQGLYSKDEADGVSTYSAGPFTNNGTVSSLAGTLVFAGTSFSGPGAVTISSATLRIQTPGSSSGVIDVLGDAVLEFVGAYELAANSNVSGPGTVAFLLDAVEIRGGYAPGVTSIAGGRPFFFNNVTLADVILAEGGNLDGMATLSIEGAMTWSSGTVNASLLVLAGASLSLLNQEQLTTKTMQGYLTNQGVVNWYEGNLTHAMPLTNYGTLNLFGADTQIQGNLLRNYGLIHKWIGPSENSFRADESTVLIWSELQNYGAVDIDVGTLVVSEGVNTTGVFDIAAVGTLIIAPDPVNSPSANEFWLDPNPNNPQAAAVTGLGTLKVQDGTLVVNRPLSLGVLHLQGGAIAGPERLTIASQFDWRAGSLQGAGTESSVIDIGAGAVLHVSGEGIRTMYKRYINNAGRVTWSTHDPIARINHDYQPSTHSNPADRAAEYTTAASAAWNSYLGEVEEARGDPTAVQPTGNNLFAHEYAAYQAYNSAETALAEQYADIAEANDAEYESAILSGADPIDAEYERDSNIAAAADWYAGQEAILYQAYRSEMSSAESTYLQRVDAALGTYRQGLWDAGYYSVANARAFAEYVHDVLYELVPPDGAEPPPPVKALLASYTAETRASVAEAYFQVYGTELQADIEGQFWGSQEDETRNALVYGQYTDPTAPDPLDRDGFLDRVSGWVSNAGNWFGNLTWDGVVSGVTNFADAAWSSTTQFVTNTAQMIRDDPLGFVQTVGEGIVNTQVVAFNAITFGVIPQLNEYSNELVQSNGFYRVIQVGAVIAREVAIGVASGGIGTVATATAGAAGRLAAGLAVRWGGIGAGRQALRAGAQIACRLTTAARVAQPYFAYRNVNNIVSNIGQASTALQNGDFETAAALMARSAGMIPGTLSSLRETTRLAGSLVSQGPTRTWQYLQACFAAGTPILGEHGARPIEAYQVGDKVWARPEHEPDGALGLKEIEECFQTDAEIWHLHSHDQVIRTTAEHPFWVKGQGWTPTRELLPGDVLVGCDGEETSVVDLCATGVFETVYNFRVADYHTYYVGKSDWGFTIWAHNACTGSYGQLRSSNNKPAGAQVNHLNQHAAFGSGHVTGGIRYRAGASIYLQGGTNVVGSQHYIFHQRLNQFWREYREGGRFFGTRPTNSQYASAVGASLRAAGVPEAEIRRALAIAREQRRAFNFLDDHDVPRIPRN